MKGQRTGRHLLRRAAQHERVQQLVRDQAGCLVEVLGSPGGGDAVTQLALESGAGQRHVAEHAHHVDHERLPLGAVQGIAPALVDQGQQVPGRLDRCRVTAGGLGSRSQPAQDPGQRADRLRRAGQVTIRLTTGQLDELPAVGGDHQRDAVGRSEHRLDWRQPIGRRREPLARPQRAELVHGLADPFDRVPRGIRNPKLLQPEWQSCADAHHDPAGRHLVEGRSGHGQHHRVAGEGIHGTEGNSEAVLRFIGPELGRDGADVADRVALEVRIVDPDRVQSGAAGRAAPGHHVAHVAARRESEPDAPGDGVHVSCLTKSSPPP
jgi:hypothetical protein